MPRVGGKAGPEGVKAGKLPLPRPVAALVGASPTQHNRANPVGRGVNEPAPKLNEGELSPLFVHLPLLPVVAKEVGPLPYELEHLGNWTLQYRRADTIVGKLF